MLHLLLLACFNPTQASVNAPFYETIFNDLIECIFFFSDETVIGTEPVAIAQESDDKGLH